MEMKLAHKGFKKKWNSFHETTERIILPLGISNPLLVKSYPVPNRICLMKMWIRDFWVKNPSWLKYPQWDVRFQFVNILFNWQLFWLLVYFLWFLVCFVHNFTKKQFHPTDGVNNFVCLHLENITVPNKAP